MYKGFSVSDAHAHVFPAKMASRAVEATGKFYDIPMALTGLSEELLEKGTKAGIDRFLVFSTATTPKQVQSINNFIKGECDAHPEFVGLATMHIDFEDPASELQRAKEMGLRGVKFHPDIQQFNIDDERMMPAYAEMARLGLPVLFHTGDDRYDYSHPRRLSNLARRFPDLICIGAHFGGYRQWDDVLTYIHEDNVFFDTSSALPFISTDMAEKLISHFGAEKYLFGTDYPMWNVDEELERFFKLSLSDSDRGLILNGNFEKLFLR